MNGKSARSTQPWARLIAASSSRLRNCSGRSTSGRGVRPNPSKVERTHLPVDLLGEPQEAVHHTLGVIINSADLAGAVHRPGNRALARSFTGVRGVEGYDAARGTAYESVRNAG